MTTFYGNSTFTVPVLMAIAICSFNCSQSPDPADDEPFIGITKTLNDPTPIGTIDPDDWKPVEHCPATRSDTLVLPTCTRPYPAYPNPNYGFFVQQIALAQDESLSVIIYRRPNSLLRIAYSGSLPAGLHALTIDLNDEPVGIYRLYLKVYRGPTTLTSYGDIEINRTSTEGGAP